MAKPPPLVRHSRNIYMGKPEESEPQRRWSCGPPSPSVTLGPGVGGGRDIHHGSPPHSSLRDLWCEIYIDLRTPDTVQKRPPLAQQKLSVRSHPEITVTEMDKKFETEEDQYKPLVVGPRLGSPAVIDREESNLPLYENVLVTQETRTFGSPAVVDRGIQSPSMKRFCLRRKLVRVAKVTGVGSASAIEASSKASGVLQGFALGMDIFFTKQEDGPKLKKGLEYKFGKKIREVSQPLNEGLD